MKFSKWLPMMALGFLLAGAIAPGSARATDSEQDFYVRTTADLAKLCGTDPSDPLYTAAIHFCQGFGAGAYQAEQLHQAGSRARPLFCMPKDPEPTRNEVLAGFTKWVAATSDVGSRAPAEGLFEYLMKTYPCPTKKKH